MLRVVIKLSISVRFLIPHYVFHDAPVHSLIGYHIGKSLLDLFGLLLILIVTKDVRYVLVAEFAEAEIVLEA